MPSKRCCCDVDCTFANDSFARADSSSLGELWNELAGDWSIASNALTVGSGNALVRNLVKQPDDEFAIRVSANVKGADDGDELRVCILWTDTDGLYAQLTLDSGGCGTFSLWRLAGGVATKIGGEANVAANPDEFHAINICYRHAYPLAPHVTAKLETSDDVVRWTGDFTDITAETPDSTGITGGLGTGSLTAEATFDGYVAEITRMSPDRETCPLCRPPCDLFEDHFTRSAIGCDWEEISGTWSATGTQLMANVGGLIRCKVPVALPPYWRVTAQLIGEDGDQARILADCPEDGSSYVAGEVTFGTGDGYIKLLSSSGGELASYGPGDFVPGLYTLCYNGTSVFFGAGDLGTVLTTDGSVEVPYTPNGHPYAGLSGGDDVKFDAFKVGHSESDYTPQCTPCYLVPACEQCDAGHEIPDQLVLDMTAVPWEDGEFQECDEILSAIYILTKNPNDPCQLRYHETGSGTFGQDTFNDPAVCVPGSIKPFSSYCEGRPYNWSLTIQLNRVSGGRWRLDIYFSGESPYLTDCNFSSNTTRFYLDYSADPAECDEFPYELTAAYSDLYERELRRPCDPGPLPYDRKICNIVEGNYTVTLDIPTP